MMKRHYTEQISKNLAWKVFYKKMPLELTTECLDSIKVLYDVARGTYQYYALPTFAEVFDWLLDNGYNITCHRAGDVWFASINDNSFEVHNAGDWKEVVEKAIEYVVEEKMK